VGIGETVRVAQEHADVVERHAADFLAFAGNGHEAAQHAQMPPVARDFDDPSDHRLLLPARGPGSVRRPISSTPTLRNCFLRKPVALSFRYLISFARTRASTFASRWPAK